jgi:prolyl-tRNA editing enzyme YbaK/EbsC (Cys-tRNA(Pro) deacylase)
MTPIIDRTPIDGRFDERLRAFLEMNSVAPEFIVPGHPMPTVSLAAAAIGVHEDRIIKSVLFKAPTGEVVLAIAAGTARIDRHRLAEVAGIPGLKLADAETVLAVTGYPAGGVAPVGHVTRIPVVVDQRVMDMGDVFGGAGTEEALLQIAPADIVRLTGAVIADITMTSATG